MEIIIIFSTILIASCVSLFTKSRNVIESSSIIASLVAFVGAIIIAINVSTTNVYIPNQFFSVDGMGAIIMLIIGLVGLMATIYSVAYLRKETEKHIIGFKRIKQYFILLNFFLGAMLLATTVSNPIFTWISIEATTLSTAFLISFYNKPSSIEGAWKYLIINSVGLLLGFFGTLLYLTSFQGAEVAGFTTWNSLVSNAVNLNPMIAKIAFIFVLIGYGTKVGLAPMHTWLPDAHSKAPAPISALLSGVLLNVAFLAVIRFKVISDAAIGPEFSGQLLIAFGLVSIIFASLINFTQKNYKRLLAYHSIENMGIAALGFGFGGIGIFAAILHIIYHALIKSALFLSAGTIFLKYSSTKIDRIKGLLTALPVTSILFLGGFFIITGTPPFGMFMTKMLVLSAGMASHPVVTVVALFSAAILFISFFNHATNMAFGEKPEEVKSGEGSIWLIIPPFILILAVCVLSFYLPPFLQALINSAVLNY